MPIAKTLEAVIRLNACGLNLDGTAGPLDDERLLTAIAVVESSGGTNAIPRHEDAFCPNQRGRNVNGIVRGRHAKWGCFACCSYGPWQILYHAAADIGYGGAPENLSQPGVAVTYVIRKLNKIVNGPPDHPVTLAEIGDAYNSGNAHDGIVPAAYIDKLTLAYGD